MPNSDTLTEAIGFKTLCKNGFSNFASNANAAKNDAPRLLISTKMLEHFLGKNYAVSCFSVPKLSF